MGVLRVLSSSPLPTLSLSALRDTKLRGKEATHQPLGKCWGPRGGALRQLKHHSRLEGRVQSPRGVVSRTEVREGRAWLGCLTPGAPRTTSPIKLEGGGSLI